MLLILLKLRKLIAAILRLVQGHGAYIHVYFINNLLSCAHIDHLIIPLPRLEAADDAIKIYTKPAERSVLRPMKY